MPFSNGISAKWNAISLVKFWTRVVDFISYDDNRNINLLPWISMYIGKIR